jgi:hypothetical protein
MKPVLAKETQSRKQQTILSVSEIGILDKVYYTRRARSSDSNSRWVPA